jgi:homoserine kinase
MLRYRVPASTTNLGHGFDCLGMAVALYNDVTISELAPNAVVVNDALGLAALTQRVRAQAMERWQCQLPALAVSVRGDVPIARGLGSSATIIVAVAAACRRLARLPDDLPALISLSAAVEGHPDNVTAACLGGFTIAGEASDGARSARFEPPPGLCAVLSIPAFEVKTSDARRILPQELTRADATRALQRTALIVAAIARGDGNALRGLFDDAWHERYRAALNPALQQIRAVAATAGAFGTLLSGSGSTILSLVPRAAAEVVMSRLRAAASLRGEAMDLRIVDFALQGVQPLR